MPVGPVEIIVLGSLVLLFFGAAKIPKLARSMGQATKEYRSAKSEAKPKPEEAGAKSEAKPKPEEAGAKRLPETSA